MAEFCEKCFRQYLLTNSERNTVQVVLSDDEDFCEGCNRTVRVVQYASDPDADSSEKNDKQCSHYDCKTQTATENNC